MTTSIEKYLGVLMSRSRRKMPILGHTGCPSERQDKTIWHQRWRCRERMALASLSPEGLSEHLTVEARQVSNVWSMGKDGRSYWPVAQQVAMAERIAHRKVRKPQERVSLTQRLLHKWMGK
jgi:hypothetical protein